MVITWGRRPHQRGEASPAARVVLVAVCLLAVLAATAGPPTLGVTPPITAGDAALRIQETLSQHLDAMDRREPFVYERTLDRRDPAFVGCMRELYALGDERVREMRPFRVTALEQVGPSLARVQVRERDGIAVHYLRRLTVISIYAPPPFDFLRNVFHVWYITPLARGEAGEERRMSQGDVTLTYWAVDQALADALVRETAVARNLAVAQRPGVRGDVRVRLEPDRGPSAATCGRESAYDPAAEEVVLYRYWTDEKGAPAERTRETIRREVSRAVGSR